MAHHTASVLAIITDRSIQYPLVHHERVPEEGSNAVSDIPFTDTLNAREAFDAFRAFLQAWYDRGPDDVIGDMLSWTNRSELGTSDPAMWYDWLAAVSSVMLPRTPEVEQLIQDTIGTDVYLVGTSKGGRWYAQTLADGSQFWVYTYHETVQAVGHHRFPHEFDKRGGLVYPDQP